MSTVTLLYYVILYYMFIRYIEYYPYMINRVLLYSWARGRPLGGNLFLRLN